MWCEDEAFAAMLLYIILSAYRRTYHTWSCLKGRRVVHLVDSYIRFMDMTTRSTLTITIESMAVFFHLGVLSGNAIHPAFRTINSKSHSFEMKYEIRSQTHPRLQDLFPFKPGMLWKFLESKA